MKRHIQNPDHQQVPTLQSPTTDYRQKQKRRYSIANSQQQENIRLPNHVKTAAAGRSASANDAEATDGTIKYPPQTPFRISDRTNSSQALLTSSKRGKVLGSGGHVIWEISPSKDVKSQHEPLTLLSSPPYTKPKSDQGAGSPRQLGRTTRDPASLLLKKFHSMDENIKKPTSNKIEKPEPITSQSSAPIAGRSKSCNEVDGMVSRSAGSRLCMLLDRVSGGSPLRRQKEQEAHLNSNTPSSPLKARNNEDGARKENSKLDSDPDFGDGFSDFDQQDLVNFVKDAEDEIAASGNQSVHLTQQKENVAKFGKPKLPAAECEKSVVANDRAPDSDGLKDSDIFNDEDFRDLTFSSDEDMSPILRKKAAANEVGEMNQVPASELLAGTCSAKGRLADLVHRYVITRILPVSSPNEELIICVKHETVCSSMHTIALTGLWAQMKVQEGNIIHVIGDYDKCLSCVYVNNDNFLIIVNPDLLISSTTVADSVLCMRKAVISERVRSATDGYNVAMLYGNIMHEIFQLCILNRKFDQVSVARFSQETLLKYRSDLLALGIGVFEAKETVAKKMPLMVQWASLFLRQPVQSDAIVEETNEPTCLSVNKVIDVEEMAWSPSFGLKGNADVTIEATIKSSSRIRTALVPFELKTGKNDVIYHRAQSMLYALILSEKYDIDISCSILYYSELNKTIMVDVTRHIVRDLILKRNEIAFYAENKDILPSIDQPEAVCKHCFVSDKCSVYHKLIEGGNAESSMHPDLFDKHTAHLTDKHAQFLNHWQSLIDKEDAECYRFRSEIWHMLSFEREESGKCFGEMVISPNSKINFDEVTRKFSYTMTKASDKRSGSVNFYESQIGLNDHVILSIEGGPYGIARCFVKSMSSKTIQLETDTQIHNCLKRGKWFDATKRQVHKGKTPLSKPQSFFFEASMDNRQYRIDRDDVGMFMSVIRDNIVNLFTEQGDEKRRRMIVDLEAPSFDKSYGLPSSISTSYMNIKQREAVQRCLSASDYSLILGMPGTGKTTVISHIIKAAVAQGKSVLLASYTHTAVDNILMKLKDDHLNILRLGPLMRIHRDVLSFVTTIADKPTTAEEAKEKFLDVQIVATTCMSIKHFALSNRQFDYCIVDEASQLTLPTCLGPLRFCKSFILVGDHYQLPPLVKSREAREAGFEVSLFKLLSEAHPEAVSVLSHQYRMNQDIMLLSNELVYDGKLVCGSETVAKQYLHIPNRPHVVKELHQNKESQISKCNGHPCWIEDILDENRHVLFLDTDNVPAADVSRGMRTQNPIEAELVRQIAEALSLCGVEDKSIGIISVYRAQLQLISRMLQHRPGLEILTADRFQGRDRECIIVSLVRSNDHQKVGELLRDWRRLNVTFTRAKSKLIIVGSRKTLQNIGILENFLKLVHSKKWIYTLPQDAHLSHNFPFFNSSASQLDASLVHKSQHTPRQQQPRVQSAGSSVVLKGRPILRDIVNSIRNEIE